MAPQRQSVSTVLEQHRQVATSWVFSWHDRARDDGMFSWPVIGSEASITGLRKGHQHSSAALHLSPDLGAPFPVSVLTSLHATNVLAGHGEHHRRVGHVRRG